MQPTVFTRIVQGEIPSHTVYDDDYCMAFMDIAPVQEGMIVLVAKEQINNFEDVPAETAAHMINVTQQLMKALKCTYPDRIKIAVQIEGLDVPHAHIKLIPITVPDDLKSTPLSGEPDHEALEKQAERIKQNI